MSDSIKTLNPARFWLWILVFAAFALACALLAPLLGSSKIDFSRALDFSVPLSNNPDRLILFGTRLPRVTLALAVGGSLALAGAVMQAMLRNPLASPFTLGVASGGTLGAAIAITLGIGRTAFKVPGTVFGSFVFSLLTLGLVWGLAYRRGRAPTGLMLLAGVSVNFLFGAIVMLLQYMSDFEQNFQLIRWMMGSLDTVQYGPTIGVAVTLLPIAVVLIYRARAFNLLALGDDAAQTAGVDVRKLEITGFVFSGLLAGAAVSQVGPIGFVGLIVPHTVRLIVGPDYRLVLPGSLLVGGGFLVLCDLLSRTVMAPVELPPGIITAILGAPFFLSLLASRPREVSV
jgi:iron complex transport system permease protein